MPGVMPRRNPVRPANLEVAQIVVSVILLQRFGPVARFERVVGEFHQTPVSADGDQVFTDRKPLRVERHHVARIFGEPDHRVERDAAVLLQKTDQHRPVVVPLDIGFDARGRPLVDPAGYGAAEVGRENGVRDFVRNDRVENPLFGSLNRHLPAGDRVVDEGEGGFAAGAHVRPALDLDRAGGCPRLELDTQPKTGQANTALFGALRDTVRQIGGGRGYDEILRPALRRRPNRIGLKRKEEEKRGAEE